MTGLAIDALGITYRTARGKIAAVRDVSLAVAQGEVLALVGESGSGKSSLAFACAAHAAPNATMQGRIALDGTPITTADRGRRVAMVFQDPQAALNPTLTLGAQVHEVFARIHGMAVNAAREATLAVLARVGLPDPSAIALRHAHETSGGEKQRVVIAMALAANPRLLVCDEPTTALDATTAAGIVALLSDLRRQAGLAVLYITHDLALAARIADRIAVLYAGCLVEEGPAERVLHAPRHPYTRLLLAAVPDPHGAARVLPAPLPGRLPDLAALPPGCVFAPRCALRQAACDVAQPKLTAAPHRSACLFSDLVSTLPVASSAVAPAAPAPPLLAVAALSARHGRRGLLDRLAGRDVRTKAVDAIDLDVRPGEVFGLIGESGCGKTSFLRALAGIGGFTGTIRFDGAIIAGDMARAAVWRRDIQLVFQNPDASLNPRMRIGAALARPLALHAALSGAALRTAVADWLARVKLPENFATRFPHQLSGGEKQRVAIARAFAARPKLVLCDEITSGLDVSVQAAILALLLQLRAETGVALLMVSHDLNLVQQVADRIAVMYAGRIVERRALTGRLAAPMHPYTEALLAAAPVPDPAVQVRQVLLPGPGAPGPGCAFAPRCPRCLGAVCDTTPAIQETPTGALACHIAVENLATIDAIWSRAA
jgi:peptide/nickel transport system ATP-binding protein